MKNIPLVSVLMPAYNSGLYIDSAIESILNQTYENFELIIINDGSTDNTSEIINRYQVTDNRIKIIDNGQNKGLVYSLNTAIAISEGKYIARMDADDISVPQRLALQVEFMEVNTSVSLLGANLEFISKGETSHFHSHNDEIMINILDYNQFAHPSVMMRKSDIIEKDLSYKSDFFSIEDYRLWVDIIISGLKVANLSDVLLKYRLHDTQVTKVHVSKQPELEKKIRMDYIRFLFGDSLSEAEANIILNRFMPQYSSSDIQILHLINKLKMLNKSTKKLNQHLFNKYLNRKMRGVARSKNKKNLMYARSGFKHKLWINNIYLSKFVSNLLHIG